MFSIKQCDIPQSGLLQNIQPQQDVTLIVLQQKCPRWFHLMILQHRFSPLQCLNWNGF